MKRDNKQLIFTDKDLDELPEYNDEPPKPERELTDYERTLLRIAKRKKGITAVWCEKHLGKARTTTRNSLDRLKYAGYLNDRYEWVRVKNGVKYKHHIYFIVDKKKSK